MKILRCKLALLPLALVSCLLALAATKVNAQTRGQVFTVNDVADSVDASPGDGMCADSLARCTLRAAIDESNATVATDAIIFDMPQPSVINLTLGELAIINGLDIVGPGARRLTVQRSTVAGTPNFRIFRISVNLVRFNIRSLTIRNGSGASGGGLLVEGGSNVSLTDAAIRDSHAASGGGIRVDQSNLVILRSLINSNVADNQGGAIFVSGTASAISITGSTITENSAASGGGVNNEGNLLLINATISRNAASQESSSIFSAPSGLVRTLNTIIGRDVGQTVPALKGQFTTLGNNIVTDSRNSTGFVNGTNNDQVSENNTIDPLLGNLADNGGQTNTLELQTGSPAINNGNNCVAIGQCPQLPGVLLRGRLDQRRRSRLSFDPIDVGAFEANALFSSSSATVGFFFFGRPGRFLYSPAILIHPTTLERRYSIVKLNGVSFQLTGSIPFGPPAEAYVLDIRAKRNGLITPTVIGID